MSKILRTGGWCHRQIWTIQMNHVLSSWQLSRVYTIPASICTVSTIELSTESNMEKFHAWRDHHLASPCPGPRFSASQFAAWQPCTPKGSIGAEAQNGPQPVLPGKSSWNFLNWVIRPPKWSRFAGPYWQIDQIGEVAKSFWYRQFWDTRFHWFCDDLPGNFQLNILMTQGPFDDRQGDLLNRIERHPGRSFHWKTASHVLPQSRDGRICSNTFAMYSN